MPTSCPFSKKNARFHPSKPLTTDSYENCSLRILFFILLKGFCNPRNSRESRLFQELGMKNDIFERRVTVTDFRFFWKILIFVDRGYRAECGVNRNLLFLNLGLVKRVRNKARIPLPRIFTKDHHLWQRSVKKSPAFGKPCLCLSDTRHFRHFRPFWVPK